MPRRASPKPADSILHGEPLWQTRITRETRSLLTPQLTFVHVGETSLERLGRLTKSSAPHLTARAYNARRAVEQSFGIPRGEAMIHMHPVAARQLAVVAPILFLGVINAGYSLSARLRRIARTATRQEDALDVLDAALTRAEILAAALPVAQAPAPAVLQTAPAAPLFDAASPPPD